MLIEYYEELGKNIENLYKKQVKLFDQYIQDKKIPQIEIYENINPFIDSLHYSKSTSKNYKYALRVYVEDVARNYW